MASDKHQHTLVSIFKLPPKLVSRRTAHAQLIFVECCPRLFLPQLPSVVLLPLILFFGQNNHAGTSSVNYWCAHTRKEQKYGIYSAGEISRLKINMVPVRSVFTATLSCFSVVFEPVRLVTFCHGDNATFTCTIVREIITTGATIFKKTTPNQLLASSCWEWCLWLLTPMVRPQWPLLLLPVTFNRSVMDWWYNIGRVLTWHKLTLHWVWQVSCCVRDCKYTS